MTRFESVRRDVSGVLASARLEVSLRWIERHLEHEEHLGAMRAIMSLASFLTGLEVSAESWKEVLLEGARCGLVSGEGGLLEELVEHYFWLGWTGSTRGGAEQPWHVMWLCRELGDEVVRQAGMTLGVALMRQYPRSPIGPYLSSHYAELVLLSRHAQGGASTPPVDFQRARQLAEQGNAPAGFLAHLTLREGAHRLLYRKQIKEGRALLKALDFDRLSGAEQLWYALAMTRSGYWLDRVRGLDALDALAQRVRHTSHTAGEFILDVPALHQGLEWVLYQEMGVAREAELDRLRGVIEELYPDANSAPREAMLGLVELSAILAGEGSISLEDASPLLTRLGEKSVAMRDDGWTRHITAARLMRAHLLEEQDRARLDLLSLDASGKDGGLVASVNHALSLLDACRYGPPEQIVSSIDSWLAEVSHARFSWGEPCAKPCFAVLPACLARLEAEAPRKPRKRELAAPGADEDAIMQAYQEAASRHETLSDAFTRLLREFVPRATSPPGYGWWRLGAHLIRHQLFEVADEVIRRAREQREEVDTSLEHHVMGTMLAWASSQQHDPVKMMYWLEACSPE